MSATLLTLSAIQAHGPTLTAMAEAGDLIPPLVHADPARTKWTLILKPAEVADLDALVDTVGPVLGEPPSRVAVIEHCLARCKSPTSS